MTNSSSFRQELLATIVFAVFAGASGCAESTAFDVVPSESQLSNAATLGNAFATDALTRAGPLQRQATCADCCPDGLPRGAPSGTLERIAAFTPSPADVAVCPNGDVFLTLDGPDQIWRVPIGPGAGPPQKYADVTGVQPAGIACDDRGRLFVAAFALRPGSSYDAAGMLLVEGVGTAPRSLPKMAGARWLTPNGVAAAADIGIYVSDTLAGTIVLVSEKDGVFASTVVGRNMLGVNGLGYDAAAHRLYATNSLTSAVVSFAVDGEGALSQQRSVWSGPFGAMLDEVEVGERGQVYVAAYGLGRVYQLPGERIIARVTNPASLAFRGGSLLVVDYHLNQRAREGGLYGPSSSSARPQGQMSTGYSRRSGSRGARCAVRRRGYRTTSYTGWSSS
jgi:DNA-binding beta-propeller fold protein YncE